MHITLVGKLLAVKQPLDRRLVLGLKFLHVWVENQPASQGQGGLSRLTQAVVCGTDAVVALLGRKAGSAEFV